MHVVLWIKSMHLFQLKILTFLVYYWELGTLDAELSVNGYTFFRCDRPLDNRGGGVLLYVRSEYHPCEYHPNSHFPEQIWCQLTVSPSESLLIGVLPVNIWITVYWSIQWKVTEGFDR